MTGFVVVGTDTDAGKTAFCAVWLAAFPDRFAYWKPVETGESDTERVRLLVPTATVHPPLARFREPVAPPLAARREGRAMPTVAEVAAAAPAGPLLIETFGSPLSPFADGSLQVELLAAFDRPLVLVSSSAVGAVGRTLQAIAGLRDYGLKPAAVVLIGPSDEYAATEIVHHAGTPVLTISLPDEWLVQGVRRTADRNHDELNRLHTVLTHTSEPVSNLIARDRAAVWHPYTSLVEADDPLQVVGAEAEFLELADGRRLIDGISSWWTIQHGHRHPPLLTAMREQAAKLDHVLFAGATHPAAVEFCELLLKSSPVPAGGRVFLSDNGSTAVEVALKLAYQAWCHRGEPGRTLFVGFEHGYHGDTFGAMAAGRDPVFFARFDPLLFRTLRVPVSADRLADTLDSHAGQVAAVILEPLVQGAGGMRMHSPAELKAIADVCRDRGVFFIADEVMTGGGRTGSPWACEQAGVRPDLLCAAKTLTGGLMPLAATVIGPEIVAAFDSADRSRTFFHGHSYTGHPLACAVAAANWRAMLAGDWRADVRRIERFWRKRLPALETCPGVTDVRVCGTIAAVEIDAPGGYLAEVGRRMRRTAVEHGVLLRPLGNVLYAMPPFRVSDGSLERIAAAIEVCVTAAL